MLFALSHVILNLSLCAAAAKAPSTAMIPLHVQVLYRVGGSDLDKTFSVEHTGDQARVEFDIQRGTFRLIVTSPKYGCSTSDFIATLSDRSRSIAEVLESGPPPLPEPVVLLQGNAPASFLYIRPTFVIFGPGQACNAAVGKPLAAHVVTEQDREGYYVWLYTSGFAAANSAFTPSLPAAAPVAATPSSNFAATPSPGSDVVALRLRTPTGLYHYVRLPITFPLPWSGWPDTIHFDVVDSDVTDVATEKTDTLLCPKFFETRAG